MGLLLVGAAPLMLASHMIVPLWIHFGDYGWLGPPDFRQTWLGIVAPFGWAASRLLIVSLTAVALAKVHAEAVPSDWLPSDRRMAEVFD